MFRLLALVGATALAAAAPRAQCFAPPDGSHTALGTGDDVLLPATAIGFPFPFAGATYTTLHVSTNGFAYLSNGGVPAPGSAVGDAGGHYGSAAAQRATLLGGAPKVLAFYRDLELRAADGAGVFVRSGDPNTPCVVTWQHAVDFGGVGAPKTIQCQLHANGEIDLFWSLGAEVVGTEPATVGRSPGGGAADPGASDLGALPSVPGEVLYETFATGAFDLDGRQLRCVPAPPNQTAIALACSVGEHAVRGAGCYGDSFYQHFADAGAATAGLQNHALLLTPGAAGYTAQWEPFGAFQYAAPSAATDLPRSDDGQAAIDLTANGLASLPMPGGAASVLWVHMNGFVAAGSQNDDGAWNEPANDWTPTPRFRNAPAAAFWAWHDWDPSDLAGGPVRWHHDPGNNRLFVTWDGVENWSSPAANNPGTFQFQFDLTTGAVRYVWLFVDGDSSSPFGSGHLLGWSPAGPSDDPGSLPLATVGGTTAIAGASALRLDAAPVPVTAAGGGSNPITFTVDHMPDLAPPAGARVGLLFFSATAAAGIDLGFVGAPGCQLWLGGLDLSLPIVALGGPQQTVSVAFPPPLPPGTVFHTQAVALLPAGSLPGGLNAFGVLTSNAVDTTF
ncbi:MAG: hypothetical protein JNL08_08915 [Planctomycetes bacterium]|nr:hypothetical protein [Planctomycetota bacterium]